MTKMSTVTAESVENGKTCPLIYKVIAKCPTTKARVGVMSLLHSDVDTPVFMPVGTQVYSKIKTKMDFSKINMNLILFNSIDIGNVKRCATRSVN